MAALQHIEPVSIADLGNGVHIIGIGDFFGLYANNENEPLLPARFDNMLTRPGKPELWYFKATFVGIYHYTERRVLVPGGRFCSIFHTINPEVYLVYDKNNKEGHYNSTLKKYITV